MRYNDSPMNSNKKFPTLIAVIALILSGCACHKQGRSSVTPSITSEISEVNTTSSVNDESEVPSSSADSSIYSSSDSSSEAISSSSKDSSSSSSPSSSSSSSSEYSVPPVEQDTNWNINLSLRGA